jgi:hypothetical protein
VLEDQVLEVDQLTDDGIFVKGLREASGKTPGSLAAS